MRISPLSGLNDNLRGSLFMVASMVGFTLEDSLIKHLTATMPLGQILMMIGLTGIVFFGLRARSQGDTLWTRSYFSRQMLWRSFFEVTGRLSYTASLMLVPLTLATAILQATPLVVVAGAAVLFGEQVGWRRWTAIFVGFLGVLIILRPGLEGFTPLSILSLIGMIGFAGRDLATRAAPPQLSNMQLGIAGFSVLSIAGFILSFTGMGMVLPSGREMLVLGSTAVCGIAAYQFLTMAMRTGEVSSVTPWRYSRLIFAAIVGFLLFGEAPDSFTILGSVMIVASGVFTLKRSAKRGKA